MTTGSSCRRSIRVSVHHRKCSALALCEWRRNCSSRISTTPAAPSREASALQLLGALAVIAAALLDPLQAAIGVGGLVGVVLIDAGVHPPFASAFLGIFRIDGGREHRRPGGREPRLHAGGVPASPWLPRLLWQS